MVLHWGWVESALGDDAAHRFAVLRVCHCCIHRPIGFRSGLLIVAIRKHSQLSVGCRRRQAARQARSREAQSAVGSLALVDWSRLSCSDEVGCPEGP